MNKTYPRRARQITERIAAGDTLEQACARKDMPSATTVRRWLLNSPDFRRRFTIARQVRRERLIDQVVEIADQQPSEVSAEEARRQKLRIDARKWAVARFDQEAFEPAALDDDSDRPLKVID
ncbi:MAG: hypothetical protein K1X35_14595 [Caulobacteraceae bacterium]|nr:hypothetical protein [Caulobacteraceae bacterium]